MKRCMTLISCEYRPHCALANIAHLEVSGYFQPRAVGEHCVHYQPLKTTFDYHDEIIGKMGSIE